MISFRKLKNISRIGPVFFISLFVRPLNEALGIKQKYPTIEKKKASSTVVAECEWNRAERQQLE